MSESTYQLLDYFFVIFHFSLILFNLTGWIWHKTRKLHLFVISTTIFSWVGLGIFYGWGYCPCTDWHWQVKGALGETELPTSYIKYYLDKVSGVSWDPFTVDILTAGLGIAALLISLIVNYRDLQAQKNQ